MARSIARLVPNAPDGPQAVMMYGPRGVGKTIMLLSAAQKCMDKGTGPGKIRVIEASANTELKKPKLVTPLLLGGHPLAKHVEALSRGAVSKDALPDHIEAGIPCFVKALCNMENQPPPHVVKPLLIEICKKTPTMLLVDEAHNLKPSVSRPLLDYAQSTASRSPFFLVLAGTPGLKPKLKKAHATFFARSHSLAVGNLDLKSARSALERPCRDAGMSISNAVLDHAVERSDLYPYFIQMWGAALWDNAVDRGAGEIVMKDVNDVEEKVDRQRRELYSDLYEDLAGNRDLRRGTESIASAIEAGRRLYKEDAVLLVEKLLSPAIPESKRQKKAVALVNEMEDTDFAWRRDEVYEAGIPSFMAYILKRAREREGS